MKTYIKTFYWSSLAFVLALPALAYAQNRVSSTLEFKNPIKYNNLESLLTAMLKLTAQLAAVVAVLMFIYAGFQYVTARGDEEKIKSAHSTFKNTAIGTAILLGAELIAIIITNTIKAVQGNTP